jgi:caffeoyl-CoA O-methyltransferase
MLEDPEGYFRRLVRTDDPLLAELEQEAASERIPIIGPVVGALLHVLAASMGAGSILELGTATGYSAILLARACASPGGRLTTIEQDPVMAERARSNLARAGLSQSAEVVCGEAMAELARLDGPFDLVFIDIDKAGYVAALPECHRLLRPRGLLVADNVAFADADGFNREVAASAGWKPVFLSGFLPQHSPEHDALCLALRV